MNHYIFETTLKLTILIIGIIYYCTPEEITISNEMLDIKRYKLIILIICVTTVSLKKLQLVEKLRI